SYEIIQISLTALERLTHRGGVDADGASGDGAGLLTSLPQKFFRERTRELAIGLPEHFGVGCAFLPGSATAEFRAAIEIAADTGRLRVLGWRRVPVNVNALGRKALETMPEPWQFPQFYEDLRDPSFAVAFAVFHQRYSTNTQPSWHLAQPFRYVAHNGEINTIVSNRRWLRAKEREIKERLKVGPWFSILEDNVSDSASFDNGIELRLLAGLSSEEAMLAMVPPAYEKDPLLSRDVRNALKALSQQTEP